MGDLYRYTGGKGVKSFFKAYFQTANYRVVFWYRLNVACKKIPILRHVIGFIYWKIAFARGVEIPSRAQIGDGLYIIHSGTVVINTKAVIGKNCTIVGNALIGAISSGKAKGSPTLGDNVYIGFNACIVGGVKVGNNALIAPNTVEVKDVPEGAVVAGNPAQVLNMNGSREYIARPID